MRIPGFLNAFRAINPSEEVLSGNKINGRIPDELGNIANLVSLDLSYNFFSGPIPDSLGNLMKLRYLRLNNNSLSGNIPMTLTNIASLQVLDLSNNNLTGCIPINGSFPIITPVSFRNNPLLRSPKDPPTSQISSTPPAPSGNSATGAIAGGVAAGATLLFAGLAIALALRRKGKEGAKVQVGQLKRFSLSELESATDNFNKKNILGKGGFGKVYKGCLADGSLVAVKRLKEDHTRSGKQQFQTEVEIISKATHHRNLLQLLGYSMTPTERLLVYPFMVNGSVASCLRGRPKSKPPLDWGKRKHIALGAARGLAHLHGHCDWKIIHRDVKAANILLDEEFEAVVGDLGIAKLMSHKADYITIDVCGTIGHIAPEYSSTKKLSEKADVFGYGVMLLELITGQGAVGLARQANDNNVMLHDWVKGLVEDRKLERLVDGDLEGQYNEEEVEQLVQVALLCTQGSAKERPKMSEVIKMLEDNSLAEKGEQWQQEEV